MSETIRLQNLIKRYSGAAVGQNAVDDVTVEIGDGELVTLLGPSGCGKTTTLRMIAGLEDPTAGEIWFGSKVIFSDRARTNIPVHRRPIGMVFQSYAIWPHMNVFENVSFPLRMDGARTSREEIRARTEEALETVGLAGFGTRPSTALSGGQQQRVALARALVRRPEILLLDEPLSNLDAKLREQMRDEIRELQQRTRITTVFVTHDQGEALAVSDRILVMNNGRIVEDGSPREIYRDPSDEFTADFIGVANKVHGRVLKASAVGVAVSTQFGEIIFGAEGADVLSVGDAVCAFIRPECLSILPPGSPAQGWLGTVIRSVFQGDHTDYHIKVAEGELRARAYGEARIYAAGESVTVSLDLGRIHLHAASRAGGTRHTAAAPGPSLRVAGKRLGDVIEA